MWVGDFRKYIFKYCKRTGTKKKHAHDHSPKKLTYLKCVNKHSSVKKKNYQHMKMIEKRVITHTPPQKSNSPPLIFIVPWEKIWIEVLAFWSNSNSPYASVWVFQKMWVVPAGSFSVLSPRLLALKRIKPPNYTGNETSPRFLLDSKVTNV